MDDPHPETTRAFVIGWAAGAISVGLGIAKHIDWSHHAFAKSVALVAAAIVMGFASPILALLVLLPVAFAVDAVQRCIRHLCRK